MEFIQMIGVFKRHCFLSIFQSIVNQNLIKKACLLKVIYFQGMANFNRYVCVLLAAWGK